MFDDKNLSPEIIQLFQKAATSPLYFAESLLIDPFLDQPFKATYPQRIIFGSKKKTTYIAAHRRSGKVNHLDALLYTPNGPKRMGDIKVGDRVANPFGSFSEVTQLHPHGKLDVYRVHLQDGTFTDVGAEHLWEVYMATDWVGNPSKYSGLPRKKNHGYRILTTKEIQDTLIYSYSDRDEFRYKLRPIAPVPYPEKVLPVDPYLLGVLLGDGSMESRIIHSADVAVINTVIQRTGYDYEVKTQKEIKKCKRYKIISAELLQSLKDLQLIDKTCKTKFIPENYLYASIDQRLWLLRGLMDTDGSSSPTKPGNAEYCSVCKNLANGTAELARSLGCKVRVTESVASYTKNGTRTITGSRFRLYITIPEGLEIFNLERKKMQGLPERYLRRTIVKIEKLEEKAEMQCITIDHPEHLYLVDQYIPTHNCISGESEIINSDTLRPSFIKNAQKETKTLTFDFAKNELVWAPCEWILSGEKECTYYGLETGVGLTLTSNHELFERTKGWIKAKYVKIGDQILAPKEIPVFGDKTLTLDELDQAWQETLIESRIPDVVFQLNKETLIKYLGTVYGEVGTTHRRDQKIVLSLKSSLLKDFHHLFLRLGIAPRIEAYNNVLTIDDKIDYNTFLCYLGIQEEILDVHGPRRWERVVDIIPVGKRKVYDLSVEHEDHNFLANDTIVHNSYSLSILAIWHALVKANQKIVIFAPSSNQVDLIFDNIDAWFFKNPIIEAMKATEGNHKTPQRRTFQNGSMITGFPLGVAGGLEKGKRGITSNVTLIDEAQELGDEDWKVVGPIMRGDRFRMHTMKNYVTGTINKAQGQFYEKINGIMESSESTEAIIKIPITQNKTYSKEEIEQLRQETSPQEWQTEWLLEADESDNSVFRNSDVDACSMEDWEYGPLHITNSEVRFIGVDWDKTQAGTNIAVLQYNTSTRVLKMIYREEVDRSEFTYVNAVNKIVDLYEVFQPELVIADQGGGEVQWELLQLESLKRKNGLANRLIKKAFNEKIDTTNQDGDLERKRIKPFLVGLLQQKVQEHRLQIPRHDKKLIDQFLQYEVKSRTENTVKFSSSNEHIIDCCLFAMYGVWTLYENFLDSFELTAPKNVSSTDFKTPWDQQLLDAQMEQERFFNPSINVPRTSFMDPFPIRSTQDFYRDEF